MPADVAKTLDILSDPTAASPGAVAADIDRWKVELAALGPDGDAAVAELNALKAALADGGAGVKSILGKLGHATIAATNGDLGLQTLGSQLSSFGTQA